MDSRSAAVPRRRAFSLTELLVAMTIALIVMASVAQLFGVFGRGLSGSQATVELSARMRTAGWQLRKDLTGVTCDVVPWLAPEADAGYFEYIEGPRNDRNAATSNAKDGTTDLEADTDDVIMFTSRAMGEPFSGAIPGGGTAESRYAEIAWFCKPMTTQPVVGLTMHNLHRRQLLVAAAPGAGAFTAAGLVTSGSAPPFSTRVGADDGRTRPNSLGDLTKRENRFLHAAAPPYPFAGGTAAGATLVGDQEGDDVVLTNVISFDVRAFEPQAEDGSTRGDYVDLGSATLVVTSGTSLAQFPSTLSGLQTTPTYDTWSTHYAFANAAVNPTGANDSSAYTTTSPPYVVPLRGIEVRIRCYEPTSRQVRQFTIRHTFVKR
jgi:prepilin-type N-terminal cleavage/methylation domain-containing protein